MTPDNDQNRCQEACAHEGAHIDAPSPLPHQAREHAVQRGRERLLGTGIERRRPASDDPCKARLLHEVAHREPLADGLGCVFLAAWIKHSDLGWHQQRRQGYVLRHYEVAGRGMRRYVLVSDVGSAVYPYRADERIARGCLEPLVRDKDGLDVQPLG